MEPHDAIDERYARRKAREARRGVASMKTKKLTTTRRGAASKKKTKTRLRTNAQEWQCGVCTNVNRCDFTYCKACNVSKGARQLGDAWVSGVSDTRVRCAILFRVIARLYGWRRKEADNGRAMHWNMSAINISKLTAPLTTMDQVDGLINIRGIGPSTVRLVREIFATGCLEYIDDLLLEVSNLSFIRSRETSTTAMAKIQESVHSLATSSPEQLRSFRREQALAFAARQAERRREQALALAARQAERTEGQNRGGRDDNNSGRWDGAVQSGVSRAEAMIQKCMRLTGAQRRVLVKSNHRQVKQEQPTHASSRTRTAAGLERLANAVRGGGEMDVCAICLEVYKDVDDLVAFDCRHCFHFECVHQWLEARIIAAVHPSCPLCRASINI